MKLTSGENNKPNSKGKNHEDPLKISQMPATSKLKEVFPRKIASRADSTAYTKKLIITAISNITYLRSLFPEESFVERKFEGVSCRVLKPLSDNFAKTKILCEWLEGAFKAIDKKYLSCLSLILYENPNDTENILENYDFNISYTDKETNLTLDFIDAKDAGSKGRLDAGRLMRSIFSTIQSLELLPDRIYMRIRLFYYEDVTPIDYEPEGYISSEFEKYYYSNGKVHIHLGQADSVWHKSSVNVTVDETMLKTPDDFQTIDETFEEPNLIEENDSGVKTMTETPNVSEKPKIYKHHLHDKSFSPIHDQTFISTITEPEEGDIMNLINKKIDNLSVTTTLPINSSDTVPSSSPTSSTKKIDCACGLNDEENLDMLNCGFCMTWQHSICYNYKIDKLEDFNLLKQNIKFKCVKCALEDKSTPTDKTHVGLTQSELYETCICRRIVVWLHELNKKTVSQYEITYRFEIKSSIAKKVFTKLENQKILAFHNKNEKVYKIDKTCLKNYIAKNMRTSYTTETNQMQALNKSVNFDLPEQINSQIQKTQASKRQIDENEQDNNGDEIQMTPDNTRGRAKKNSPKRKRKSSITRQEICI